MLIRLYVEHKLTGTLSKIQIDIRHVLNKLLLTEDFNIFKIFKKKRTNLRGKYLFV